MKFVAKIFLALAVIILLTSSAEIAHAEEIFAEQTFMNTPRRDYPSRVPMRPKPRYLPSKPKLSRDNRGGRIKFAPPRAPHR